MPGRRSSVEWQPAQQSYFRVRISTLPVDGLLGADILGVAPDEEIYRGLSNTDFDGDLL
jgi:hypothetical protein